MVNQNYYKAIVACKNFIQSNLWERNGFDLVNNSPEKFWDLFCYAQKTRGQNGIVLRAAMKAVLMASSIYEDGNYYNFFMPATKDACDLYKEARKSLKKGFHTSVDEVLYSDGSPSGEYQVFVW